MEDSDTILEIIGEKLSGLMTSDLVVGDALELGDVTIVPLSRVSIGLGGGGGRGSEEASPRETKNSGSGDGGGGGGQLKPIAVAVFNGDSVEVMKVPTAARPIEKLLGKLPDLIDRFKD
jgi:uncharacterized spore protein YtfJ